MLILLPSRSSIKTSHQSQINLFLRRSILMIIANLIKNTIQLVSQLPIEESVNNLLCSLLITTITNQIFLIRRNLFLKLLWIHDILKHHRTTNTTNSTLIARRVRSSISSKRHISFNILTIGSLQRQSSLGVGSIKRLSHPRPSSISSAHSTTSTLHSLLLNIITIYCITFHILSEHIIDIRHSEPSSSMTFAILQLIRDADILTLLSPLLLVLRSLFLKFSNSLTKQRISLPILLLKSQDRLHVQIPPLTAQQLQIHVQLILCIVIQLLSLWG